MPFFYNQNKQIEIFQFISGLTFGKRKINKRRVIVGPFNPETLACVSISETNQANKPDGSKD